jgi:hypothetical protein
MAKRRVVRTPSRSIDIFISQEEERAPRGHVLWADPSTVGMTKDVHTFNDPHSPASHGERRGFDEGSEYNGTYWRLRDYDAQRKEMLRKRGCSEEE